MTNRVGRRSAGGAPSIIEVSPRDGLQNEKTVLTTEAKSDLVAELVTAGAERIEVTSFVRPDSIPQLADADELMEHLGPGLRSASLIGLVLNRRGAQRAVAHERIDELNFVVPCTSSFGRANQGMSTDDALAAVPGIVDLAHSSGRRCTVTLAVAFGCPYEGVVPPEHVLALVEAVAQSGLDELAIADTLGCAVPAHVTGLVASTQSATDTPLRMHFHDTRRTGLANVWSALQSGVTMFDASAGGVGGCPFAPGAAGNVATEDLAWMFETSGLQPSIDARSFARIGRDLCGLLGTESRSGVGRSGVFPGVDTVA